MNILLMLLLLQIKHLIFDWLWQPPYEYLNKGTYLHPGGLRHAAKNAIGTALCLFYFIGFMQALALAFLDLTIHYHIDWCKNNINKYYGWTPTTTDNFWRLTGFDQFLHQITYLAIAFVSYLLIEKNLL